MKKLKNKKRTKITYFSRPIDSLTAVFSDEAVVVAIERCSLINGGRS